MQPKQKSGGDGLYWLIALILIFTGAGAPIGVLMIVLKLLDGKKHRSGQTFHTQQQQGPVGARTTTRWSPVPPKGTGENPSASARQASAPWVPTAPRAPEANQASRSSAERALAAQERTGNLMTVIGAILSFCFGTGATSELAEGLSQLLHGNPDWALDTFLEAIPILCFLAGGLGVLLVGLRRRRRNRRFRTYLAMIGKRKTVPVSSLAAATGSSPALVRDDLADMLTCGILPQGFLDYGSDRLILSGEGLLEEEENRQASSAPRQSPEDAILSEIREVNQMIDNEKLSAQIDRIGVITSRILDYQRSHPDQSTQLHSFLSYYLPTTLKILRAYAQLEDQEVSGTNISSAMKRIEGMMDKVVEGFEKQLDLLFQGDAMDITADVEVLERMLAMDGLSDRDGMTLNL